MVEVTCHDAFTQQLAAAHVGFHRTAPMVAAPFFPDSPTQCAPSVQDLITRIASQRLVFQSLAFFSVGMMAYAALKAMPSWRSFVSQSHATSALSCMRTSWSCGTSAAKATIAVDAVRSTLKFGHQTGVSAMYMSLDGKLALGSIVVQVIGLCNTFQTIRDSKDPEKVQEAWLGFLDSSFGAVGGLMQLLTVVVEARYQANALTTALATSAIEKSLGLTAMRFAGALAGMAGGGINAFAMVIQLKKSKEKHDTAASNLYQLSAFMFIGTSMTSAAVGIGAAATTAVARGSTNAVVHKIAQRGAGVVLWRVAGVTILSASGLGWAFLVLGVAAQLTAVALTPSDLQRWVRHSYFGRSPYRGRSGVRVAVDRFRNWEVEKNELAKILTSSVANNPNSQSVNPPPIQAAK